MSVSLYTVYIRGLSRGGGGGTSHMFSTSEQHFLVRALHDRIVEKVLKQQNNAHFKKNLRVFRGGSDKNMLPNVAQMSKLGGSHFTSRFQFSLNF